MQQNVKRITKEEIKEMVKEHLTEIKENVRLGFPLDERINMEDYNSKTPVVSINETNAKRMLDRHSKYGYIIISPCRGCEEFGISKEDPQWKQKLANANQQRIKDFINILKQTEYSYTPVYGGFIENFGTDQEENVYERSFMIYAHNKQGKPSDIKGIFDFGKQMAQRYNQDSFLFKSPNEPPKYIKPNRSVDLEFSGDASFNDFSQEYFTDLHKNTQKHSNKTNGKPTRFTFMEAYINPTSENFSARAPRHFKGEVFL